MGNAIATIIGTVVHIFNKIVEKAGNLKSSKKDYYQAEILLKDEENQAGTNLLK